MATSGIFIVGSIVILVVIAAIWFFVARKKKQERLSPLAAIAFAFVIAGIAFGDDRLIGYGLMGIGIILAITDMVLKLKRRN
jgi:hypothetical protein